MQELFAFRKARPRLVTAFLLAVAAMPFPAAAETNEPPEREASLIVYGDDPCPKSGNGDIVVCARRPESDRYRIPKALRRNKAELSESSWASRFDDLDEATRFTRPNSCSVVGSGGQSGCTAEMIRRWWAERRAMKDEAANIP